MKIKLSTISNFFKSMFNRKNKEITKEVIRMAGHTWTVIDPVKMSNTRKVKLFWEDYDRDWGFTKNDHLTYDEMVIDLCKSPKVAANLSEFNAELIDKLANIKTVMEQKVAVVKQDYQYKPMLKAACVIVLMDDEDETKIDADIFNQKLKLCQDNPELEAFFLRSMRALKDSMQGSFDISKVSTWLPSEQLKVMEKNCLKRINTTIYEIGDL